MNWTGGARYRIKPQGERKIQKEFFERKRFGTLKACSRSGNKKGLSQDLLALHTVSRAHSKNKSDERQRKSIKNVDLDKFQSCTKAVEEVDLGPVSPTPTPSRLLLMEPKDNLNQPPSGARSEAYLSKFQKDSLDMFLKPDSSSDQSRKSVRSDNHHNKRTPQKHASMESTRVSEGDLIAKCAVKGTYSSSFVYERCHLPILRFQKHGKRSHSYTDPFANEDFQVTPLGKYSKHDSRHLQSYNSQEKREQFSFCNSDLTTKHSKRGHCDTYFTSTPLKDSDKIKLCHGSKHKFDFSYLGSSFSPIDKLPRHHVSELEDDFTYHPRPMVATPENSLSSARTPVFPMSSFYSSTADTKTEKDTSVSTEPSCPWVKSDFGLHPCLSDTESIFRQHGSDVTSTKETFLESVEKNNVFLMNSSEDPFAVARTVFKEDNSKFTPKSCDEIVLADSNSSLMQYRQRLISPENIRGSSAQHTKGINLSVAEKSHTVSTAEETEKPILRMCDPDFQYKPCRKITPKVDKKADIMTLYQKYKEASITDCLLPNHLISSHMMETTSMQDVSEKSEGSDINVRRLSGGEVREFNQSPKVAEDYPEHLHHRSTALSSKSIGLPSKEDHSTGMVNSSEDDKRCTPRGKLIKKKVKHLKNNSPMDEVLREMKDLDQQDSVIEDELLCEDSCNNWNQLSKEHAGLSAEQKEIDHFLESERKFWATISPLEDKSVFSNPVEKVTMGSQMNKTNDKIKSADSQTGNTPQKNECQLEVQNVITQPSLVTADDKDVSVAPGNLFEQDLTSRIMRDIEGTVVTEEREGNINTSSNSKKAGLANGSKSELKGKEYSADPSIVFSTEGTNMSGSVVPFLCVEKVDQFDTSGRVLDIPENLQTIKGLKPAISSVLSNGELTAVTLTSASTHLGDDQNHNSVNSSENQWTENHKVPRHGLEKIDIKTESSCCPVIPRVKEQTKIQQFKLDNPSFVLETEIICKKSQDKSSSGYFVNISNLEICQKEMDSIQDPQVSSGCNQGVQTEKIICIDVAVSPCVHRHHPVSAKSVGIQCNFDTLDKMSKDNDQSKVPKLGYLAGSFIGFSYRKSMNFVSLLSKNLGPSSKEPAMQEETSVLEASLDNESSSQKQCGSEIDVQESQSYSTADSAVEDTDESVNTKVDSR